MTASCVAVDFHSPITEVTVQGSPSECIEKVREVGQAILGDRPWRITKLDFFPPHVFISAISDREWNCYAELQRV